MKKLFQMSKPITGDDRDKLIRDIGRLNLKHPITMIAVRLKYDKGNISAYLRGSKPVAQQFYKDFYVAYGEELKAIRTEGDKPTAPLSYTISAEDYAVLVEETKENGRMLNEILRLCNLILEKMQNPYTHDHLIRPDRAAT